MSAVEDFLASEDGQALVEAGNRAAHFGSLDDSPTYAEKHQDCPLANSTRAAVLAILSATKPCPNECRFIALDGEDDFDAERGTRVLIGSRKVKRGTVERWEPCPNPSCHGSGTVPIIPLPERATP